MSATDVGNSNGVTTQQLFHFELHSPDFSAPDHLVTAVREKLQHRLRKFGRHVLEVVVHLRDLNGPKGGVGMTCHIEARMPHLEPVNVEETEHDLYAAIDNAVDRIEGAIGRHVDRAFKHPRDRGKLAQRSKVSEG